MTKSVGIVTVSLFLAVNMLVVGNVQSAAGEAVNARTVAEHMDKSKYSTADIKSYVRDLKDKEIVASGKVHNVLSGRYGAKVVIRLNIPGNESPFIIDIRMNEVENIHKGDTISCKGAFVRAGSFGIVVEGSCTK